MAENKQAAPALFMVALLLFSAATPTAYGQLGQLQRTLSVIKVNGSVCCSSTGNCNATTPGLPGMPVSVMCTAEAGQLRVVVGQGLTGLNGIVSLDLILSQIPSAIRTSLITFLNNGAGPIVPCQAFLNLQALKLNETLCPLLRNVDALVAPLGTINSVVSSLLGLVGLVNLLPSIAINVNVS